MGARSVGQALGLNAGRFASADGADGSDEEESDEDKDEGQRSKDERGSGGGAVAGLG